MILLDAEKLSINFSINNHNGIEILLSSYSKDTGGAIKILHDKLRLAKSRKKQVVIRIDNLPDTPTKGVSRKNINKR